MTNIGQRFNFYLVSFFSIFHFLFAGVENNPSSS